MAIAALTLDALRPPNIKRDVLWFSYPTPQMLI